MVIVAGRNIAPERGEAALIEHPKIRHAAVIGVEDALRGARLVALLAPGQETPSRAELLIHCRARLGDAETPSRFYLASAWPRLASGKTDLTTLRALLDADRLEELS